MAAEIPGWTHVYSGKVRDLYEPAGPGAGHPGDVVLVVASDRISAYDHVLPTPIPDKGAVLTALSLWWFETLGVPHHVVSTDVPDAVAGRAMVCRRLAMFPIECVARGYLTGSGLVEYRESGEVCGVPLPDGLEDGSRLPRPIFTPARKADLGEHDENITFEKVVELVGADRAAQLRDTSLSLYTRAAAIAEEKGLILADTKFEFGVDADGVLHLADEVLTSDSSRYWDAEAWRTGATPEERMASFDKQIVRNWLAAHWDKQGEPPTLPDEIVERTADRYRELIARLTDRG